MDRSPASAESAASSASRLVEDASAAFPRRSCPPAKTGASSHRHAAIQAACRLQILPSVYVRYDIVASRLLQGAGLLAATSLTPVPVWYRRDRCRWHEAAGLTRRLHIVHEPRRSRIVNKQRHRFPNTASSFVDGLALRVASAYFANGSHPPARLVTIVRQMIGRQEASLFRGDVECRTAFTTG